LGDSPIGARELVLKRSDCLGFSRFRHHYCLGFSRFNYRYCLGFSRFTYI